MVVLNYQIRLYIAFKVSICIAHSLQIKVKQGSFQSVHSMLTEILFMLDFVVWRVTDAKERKAENIVV